jgi:hypothetical protein
MNALESRPIYLFRDRISLCSPDCLWSWDHLLQPPWKGIWQCEDRTCVTPGLQSSLEWVPHSTANFMVLTMAYKPHRAWIVHLLPFAFLTPSATILSLPWLILFHLQWTPCCFLSKQSLSGPLYLLASLFGRLLPSTHQTHSLPAIIQCHLLSEAFTGHLPHHLDS